MRGARNDKKFTLQEMQTRFVIIVIRFTFLWRFLLVTQCRWKYTGTVLNKQLHYRCVVAWRSTM